MAVRMATPRCQGWRASVIEQAPYVAGEGEAAGIPLQPRQDGIGAVVAGELQHVAVALQNQAGMAARVGKGCLHIVKARFQRIGKTRQIGEAVVAGGVGVEAVFAETVDEFKGEVVRGARDYGEGQRAGEVHEMLPGGAGVLVWHGKSLRYNARSFYRGLQDGLE